MQAHYFTNGAFVIHKIKGNFKGRCSAWFDADGVLQDAEQIIPSGAGRPVKHGASIWRHCQDIGRIFHKPAK